MLKVFLVEDEVVMRNGIKNNIPWEQEGFEFAGEASDGELAYPLIKKEKPDILITDTWTSMGEEAEKEERKKIFKDYQINRQLLAAANAGAMVQHCLPAYRGQEITEEVFEEHADEIFNEAENRLHAQKALLTWLAGKARGDESLLA